MTARSFERPIAACTPSQMKVASMANSLPSQAHASAGQAPVIACLDGSHQAQEIAQAAAHYAHSFDRPLILWQVLEHPSDFAELPDPFAWGVRRQEARRELVRLRDSLPGPSDEVSLELNEGDWLTGLTALHGGGADGALLVVGTPGSRDARNASVRLAGLLSQACPNSVLFVPPGYKPRVIGAPRIAVPIDGSHFAEAALAEATRLARQTKAEILLIHVVPDAGLTEFGPPATSDLELRMRLDRRNEQAACSFLETTRRRLIDQGLAARSLCLKGDPRSALLRALGEEAPDLVILSTRGQGGRRCSDLAIGGTASYLVDHLTSPVMLVRPAIAPAGRHLPFAPSERMSGAAHLA
jgi:nucleotide-binding universal stress UspA family protein